MPPNPPQLQAANDSGQGKKTEKDYKMIKKILLLKDKEIMKNTTVQNYFLNFYRDTGVILFPTHEMTISLKNF